MKSIFFVLVMAGNYYIISKLCKIIKRQELEIKLLKEIIERE